MAHEPITNIDDPRYVKAISHPLRVRILAMLQERTASPSELSKAALKFVEQVEKIEQASKERQEKKPHSEPVGNAAVVLMAFEAARLSGQEPEHKPKRGA